ncbi:hypothetical protein MBLNU459_g6335t1 [Dothideomycetes sp. NU459]
MSPSTEQTVWEFLGDFGIENTLGDDFNTINEYFDGQGWIEQGEKELEAHFRAFDLNVATEDGTNERAKLTANDENNREQGDCRDLSPVGAGHDTNRSTLASTSDLGRSLAKAGDTHLAVQSSSLNPVLNTRDISDTQDDADVTVDLYMRANKRRPSRVFVIPGEHRTDLPSVSILSYMGFADDKDPVVYGFNEQTCVHPVENITRHNQIGAAQPVTSKWPVVRGWVEQAHLASRLINPVFVGNVAAENGELDISPSPGPEEKRAAHDSEPDDVIAHESKSKVKAACSSRPPEQTSVPTTPRCAIIQHIAIPDNMLMPLFDDSVQQDRSDEAKKRKAASDLPEAQKKTKLPTGFEYLDEAFDDIPSPSPANFSSAISTTMQQPARSGAPARTRPGRSVGSNTISVGRNNPALTPSRRALSSANDVSQPLQGHQNPSRRSSLRLHDAKPDPVKLGSSNDSTNDDSGDELSGPSTMGRPEPYVEIICNKRGRLGTAKPAMSRSTNRRNINTANSAGKGATAKAKASVTAAAEMPSPNPSVPTSLRAASEPGSSVSVSSIATTAAAAGAPAARRVERRTVGRKEMRGLGLDVDLLLERGARRQS